jgi:hypothetical protein
MEMLQPYLNLVILLTVLSIIAERMTNVFKLRRDDLKLRSKDEAGEKNREQKITLMSVAMGILVAVLAKANLFEILANLESPWTTLGWVELNSFEWVRSPSSSSFGAFLYSLGGSIITGLALSFGSKFWHEILDTVFELRGIARGIKEQRTGGQTND